MNFFKKLFFKDQPGVWAKVSLLKLDGSDPKNYIWKTKNDIMELFFWPTTAQRLDEGPVPYDYFFMLANNFYYRFAKRDDECIQYVETKSQIIKYIHELEDALESYNTIWMRYDDYKTNHSNFLWDVIKWTIEEPVWFKYNFVEYLDTEEKRTTVYNAYLLVRNGILKYRKEIEEKFGPIDDSELNDHSMLLW